MAEKLEFKYGLHFFVPLIAFFGMIAIGFIVGSFWSIPFFDSDPARTATAFFAFSAILATMSGFTATATVFLAGASGRAVEKLRAEIGIDLPIYFGWSILLLFIGSIICVTCGLRPESGSAQWVALGVLIASVICVMFVVLALIAAFSKSIR